jgi:signal transduction histidine kinase
MTPIPVPQRWLGVILVIALLLDTVMVLQGNPGQTLLSLPAAALMIVCAWFAVRWPAIGAILGALTLTASSVVMRSAGIRTSSIGLADIMLTELVAGLVLVILVVWRCSALVAFACVVALVVACLGAMIMRRVYCYYDYGTDICEPYNRTLGAIVSSTDMYGSLLFGFVLLAGAIGAGVYLRQQDKQRVETEMSALVRKQWPLGAALGILALIELSGSFPDNLLAYATSVGAGVCAFFGPKYPRRNAYLTAGLLLLGAMISVGTGGYGNSPPPLTGLAASMAITSYLVRYVERKPATWGVVTLAIAMLVALAVRTGGSSVQSYLFVMAFLLGVSIATGWYFRARDRERNQTVKAAVTSAQQGERMALARELHDVVAHHVTGIVVQAQAALLVAERNPDVALPALAKIEKSGTLALTAMRTLVGSLREGTAAWTAGDSDVTEQATTDLAADLHGVVENYGGPPVELDLDLPPELPHEMGRSVLRLVQESLTNVGKHAPNATAVHVRVATVGDTLHIRVSDDGTKRPVNPAGGSGGYGLVGMRERVELLGGRFEAGPSGYIGWNVEAWLPLRKEGS